MAFTGFEEFVLTNDSLGLFEELYSRHVEEDVDRLNFAMGKVEAYVKEHKTFAQAKDLLDLLLRKATVIREETILCEDNYPFVWTYVSTMLTVKGATLGLQAVEAKMRETVRQRTMPVSYLMALGQDSARSIQSQIDATEAEEQRVKEEAAEKIRKAKEEEEARAAQEAYARTHPSDPEERRRLFASRFS
jgi:hypothetical protein